MNILMLGTSFPRHKNSGIGKFVFELAKSLASLGNDVNVLTTNFPGGNKKEIMSGVNVHRFNYFLPAKLQRLTWPGGLPDQLKISWLARIQLPFFLLVYIVQCALWLRKSDVVVCNWIYTGTIMQFARVFAWRHCPCLIVIRGSDMKMIESAGIISKIFLKTLKSADAVCVVAEGFVEPLQSLGVNNVYFTPNGIEKENFSIDKELAFKHLKLADKPIVLYAGSLIDRKDVGTLVEAMDGIDALLVIVGDGERRVALEKTAKLLSVKSLFVGEVDASEMPYWMAAATVFALPSLYEGRPNVLIEALASGKACIATNIKGTKELILDGKTGFLVEPQKVKSLHDKIELLLDNEQIRGEIEEASLKHLENIVPTWQAAASNYIKIIEDIIG